jgi:hypothetical protein
MQTYILSRSNSTNDLSPSLLSGVVDQYQIISQTPQVGSDLNIDPTTGLILFTGQSNSQISSVLIEGSNDTGSWYDTIYVISPIEIPYGTITANTIVVGNVEQTQTNLNVDPAGTAFLNALIYG